MDTIKKALTGKTKKIAILIVGVVVLAGIICGGILFARNRRAQSASTESAYRQYTAQRGSITMGISESGTALVTRSYLSFPVSAQVEEVYVKVGSVVASGDKIAKLSAEDVQEMLEEYQLQLSSAQVELETAITESKIRLAQAEDAYETSLLDGEMADGVYSYTVTKKESDISSARNRIADLRDELDEYEDLEDGYDWYSSSYNKYNKAYTAAQSEYDALKNEYETYINTLDELRNALADFNSSGTAADAEEDAAEEDAAAEEGAAEEGAAEEEDAADESVSALGSEIEKYEQKVKDAFDKLTEKEKALSEAKTTLDDFTSQYSREYGNMDADSIANRIDSIKSDISSARNELNELLREQESAELSAEHTRDITVLEAETAQEVYNETVAQINNNVKEKQNNYSKLKKEYDALLENIGDGLYLYADCDGAVSSVNISEGDTLGANQSVVTIMDSDQVYVTVSVSEDDISTLYVGQPASVTLSAYEGITVDAEIDTIGVEPARSSGSVSYTVSVKMDPTKSVTVYEGMTCEITFLQKQVSDVVYVNTQAVQYKGNGVSSVLVYDVNGEVVEKEVITGFTDGRFVEIIQGLSAGDTVLVESAVRLS